jgi:hypothetical protein
MTSERLGEMFKGYSEDIYASVDGGKSGTVKHAQTGSEYPLGTSGNSAWFKSKNRLDQS